MICRNQLGSNTPPLCCSRRSTWSLGFFFVSTPPAILVPALTDFLALLQESLPFLLLLVPLDAIMHIIAWSRTNLLRGATGS
jgi:hypothetical protein